MEENKLGATGKFPKGRLNKEDEGELRFSISCYKDNVIIDFGKNVNWIGLPKEQAIFFAEVIIKKANELK